MQKTLRKRVLQSQENIYKNYSLEELRRFVQNVELPLASFVDYPTELLRIFYEQQPWLKNASVQAQRDYFIARNNRLTRAVIEKRKRRLQQLHTRVKLFINTLMPFKADNVIAQTARKVSPQVKQLLIGEEHDQPAVSAAILQLVKEIRARNPHRRIICFSEFIVQDFPIQSLLKQKASNKIDQGYFNIYSWMQDHQIRVFGLEPKQVGKYQTVQQLHTDGHMHFEKHYIWETLLGIQWRNQQWFALLQKYRQLYPDALFIIHAGSGHTGYAQPFTLTEYFNPQETFVVHVQKKAKNNKLNLSTVDQFNVAALGWTNKELSHLVGFDVLLTVD